MNNKQERQRLKTLFSDLERLAVEANGSSPEIQSQIEEIRSRLMELEKGLTKGANDPKEGSDTPSVEGLQIEPRQKSSKIMLYEKDRIAYSYSNNKLELVRGSGSPVTESPNIRTSVLKAGEQAIGEMRIASPPDRELTNDDMSLADSVAQQASLQIQNLRLLADAERSRTEAETATRRFMHEGWDSYLDAINRDERIGYSYDLGSVTPYSNKLKKNKGLHKPIKLVEEEVGALYLEPDPNRPVTGSDQELIDSVARQVAQQVENIRLLADASRARAEAEDAIRRLTRSNWDTFTAGREDSELSFIYDSVKVSPHNSSTPDDVVLTQPLIVQGEAIGQLSVAGGKQMSQEAAQLAVSIAQQTSIHLETLRLSEELQKRAKELEELDRLKSAFLANMSHELRTPLNSILGFTDVMLEGLDGDLTEYMDNDLRLIQKNGQHLLHLINDVLDMAKIESGKMNLHPEKFKVHEVLDEVNSITSTLASEKNTALFIEEDSDHEVEIFADNTRVRQVLINLVNNAIKFTKDGKISMRVSQIDGARVLLSVKDTGIGIPPHMLESIFEEFSQVDTSTTRKAGGTGLGLPISRKLVDMHGGRLWAESTGVEGEGSTFFVELPIEARITEVIEKQEK